MGRIIPYIMENKKCSKPPNQLYYIVKKQRWIQTCVHAFFLCLSLSRYMIVYDYICAYDFTLKGLLHPKKWTPNTPTTTYLTKGSVSNLSDQSSDSAFPRVTLASKIDSLAIVHGNQSMKLSLWWNIGACVCVGTPVPEGTQIKSNLGVSKRPCLKHTQKAPRFEEFSEIPCWINGRPYLGLGSKRFF